MAQFTYNFTDPAVPADPIYWVDAFQVFGSFQDAAAGPGVTIRFAFKETGTSPAYGMDARVLTAEEKAHARVAMNQVSSHANVTFVETSLASADIVFARGDERQDMAGITFNGYSQWVEVWGFGSPNLNNDPFVYKHELEHALGLDHSTTLLGNTFNPLPADQDTGVTIFGWGVAGQEQDYRLFDVATLQYLYGPPNQRTGNDTYTLNPGVFDPLAPQSTWPLLWDGGGFDTLDYSALAVPVNISLEAGELSRINGATGHILEAGVFSINYRTVIEAVNGGSKNDQLSGNGADNTLDGKGGADTMAGRAGNDTYFVDNAADKVIEAPGGGIDQVNSAVSFTLAGHVDNLTLTGTAATGTGNGLNNTIKGNGRVNTLDGKGGADTMIGFGGNDIYVVNIAADKAIEAAGGGIDRVNSAATFTLGGHVENLTLTGAAAINGTGNGLGNAINGNGARNTLTGLAGNDTLKGFAGNDLLIGGLGKDTMDGGAGNDRFDFNTVAEIGKGITRDVVVGFAHLVDKIDLATIDANGAAGGNAFKFLAANNAAFTGVAGQLRWFRDDQLSTLNDKTIVEGDTNGNKVADFQIQLAGLKSLSAADFVL